MPAPVPPGFTRGPIIFIGAITAPQAERALLQSFWDEAGSYGARILIVPTAAGADRAADHYRTLFAEWETESVTVLSVHDRKEAAAEANVKLVENATGILLLDGNPLRFTSVLGGSPLAQALRRANARGRVVCAIGRSGSILCQHMIAFDNQQALPNAFVHRSLIQFAPGLGLVNRLVIDAAQPGAPMSALLGRLITAVAYNPFLIGAGVEPNTGLVLYANSVTEVFGAGSVVVTDGWQISQTTLHSHAVDQPASVSGVQMSILTHGCTFDLDSHVASQPVASEIPGTGYDAYSSF